MPKTVLIALDEFGYGGRQRYTFNLIQGLVARGIRVVFATGGGAMLSRLPQEVRVEIVDFARGGEKQDIAEEHILFAAQEEGVELIHAQTKTSLLCSARASEELGIPLVDHEHHHYVAAAYPQVVAQLRAYADLVLTLGPKAREKLVDAGLEPARVATVFHGVSLTDFPRTSNEERKRARENLGLREEDAVAIAVSRMVLGKGMIALTESFIEVAQRVPRAKLLLVGDDPNGHVKDFVERLVARNKLSDRVCIYPGTFDTKTYLAAADVFCHPMLAKGLSVMEAMATGLPVIGNNTPHKPFVVEDGVTGFLMEPLSGAKKIDRKALSEKLTYALSHLEELHEMGERAHEKIAEEFSFEKHLEAVLALYEKIIAEKAQGRSLPKIPAPLVEDDRYLREA